jgi:hypothetical protein
MRFPGWTPEENSTVHRKPQPSKDGDWTCAVAAYGWRGSLGPIIGVDSWQGFMLAQRLLEYLLKAEVKRGAILYWPGSAKPITVAKIFDRWR